jgi:HEAT repeat protein
MIDNSTENPAPDDAIDRAIRDALQSDVDHERVASLEHFWRVQSQRDRWRRMAWRTVAAVAATVAIVAGGIFVWHRDQQQLVEARSKPDSGKATVQSISVAPPVRHKKNAVELSNLPGRSPTAYEQLVFAARSGVETQPKSNATAIDTLIQRVAADDAADPAKLLKDEGIKHAAAEALLLRQLPRSPANRQQAILRLLAACGSPRSVPALLRLAKAEPMRADALITLEQIVGEDGLTNAVGLSTDSAVRKAIVLRLLASDSQDGLPSFLSLVANPATRADALLAAKSMPTPPIERLIPLLDSPDESVRVYSAIALGHINGPETTQLLIARITQKPANSREAWLALMECRGATAREFLAYATRSPQLLGYYNNARVRWAQVIQ